MSIRHLIKSLVVYLGLPLTKNLVYDIHTRKIMERFLKKSSNCIDIGCHKGEIMDDILCYASEGKHYAFEPLPHLFEFLKEKYKGKDISIFQLALFDRKGTTTFNYVVNAPAYSGIRKRHYDITDVQINELTVETGLLDDVIPADVKIDFIKIDVEGAEFPVLKGSVKTISKSKPLIIFEFGIGAADYYGSKPEPLFDFLTGECGMKLFTLKGLLKNQKSLTVNEFSSLYNERKEYYFAAYR
ncbi:MAG: FkbM family methyltransferase [Bacteroidota bacterium]